MLTKGKIYYWAREGKHVVFTGYDESGLAQVTDGTDTDYVCTEDQLQPLQKNVKMTIEEIIQREG